MNNFYDFALDFPNYINISSSGSAAVRQSDKMGVYELDCSKSAQLRPVYKKTDRDYYIYYNSKTSLHN